LTRLSLDSSSSDTSSLGSLVKQTSIPEDREDGRTALQDEVSHL